MVTMSTKHAAMRVWLALPLCNHRAYTCGEECGKRNMKHCQECAAACKACAKECRAIAA